ncbi:hypothetical protein KWS_0104070 [Xanthomonas vasicola pv. musacearum NCPPB 4384]|nr:hypothetical protein KWS_0104070 [Xanthomonas vasicola pv. musacearum NCPPB 4384]
MTAAATALAVRVIGAGKVDSVPAGPPNNHQAAPAISGTANNHGQREDLVCIVELLTSTTSKV